LPVNYVNSSDTRGTQYRLAYSFKANYTYQIVVNAAEKTSTQGSGNNLYLRLALSGSSGSTNPPCKGPENRTRDISGNDVAQTTNGATFTDYTLTYNPSSAFQSLDVTAYSAVNGGSNAIRLRKIAITETAPAAPVFTLPTSTNVTCGSTAAKTFTVTTQSNPNNLTITDYTWNLGATPNGWLYNGNAAPQTISTGTTASINLTPACGTVQSNISATVTAGGNFYNTNICAINKTAPSLSITGDASICSGSATYSIANLPCDASVTWSLSPNSGIVSPNCTSCPSITLTKTGSGTVTLSATVTTSCSGVQPPTPITITVGDPNLQFQVYASIVQDCYLTNEYYDFYVMPTTEQQASIVRYVWGYRDLSTNLGTVTQPDGGSGEAILFPYEGRFDVFVQVESLCGSNTESVYNFITASESCPGFAFNASVAPNPSQSDVLVTLTDQNEDLKALPVNTDVTMDLYQVNSTQKVKQWKFKHNRSKYQINVRGLHKGVYTLVITMGKYKCTKQLLVR
jgi:hypothetical protein